MTRGHSLKRNLEGISHIFGSPLPSPVAVHAAGSRRRRATVGTTTMRLARAMRASRGSPGRGPGAACAAKGETRRPGEGPAPAKASPHPRTHRLGRADRGERRRLGDSDLRVSLASLDASTWTRIGDEVEAHAQLSLAVDNGVNLVDVGSCDHLGSTRDGMPRSASSSSSSSATIFELTRGRADAYLGSWLRRSRDTRREDLVVAASVPFGAAAGAAEGGAKGRRRRIKNLVERTLMAADTDHVDLLQLHYPRRDSSAMHGGDAPDEDEVAALLDLVGDGKARFLGVDDDTRWAALETARLFADPKILVSDGLGSFVKSARGEYNLLARDGFECCVDGGRTRAPTRCGAWGWWRTRRWQTARCSAAAQPRANREANAGVTTNRFERWWTRTRTWRGCSGWTSWTSRWVSFARGGS